MVPALAVLLVAHPNPQTLSRALGVLGGGAGLLGLLPGLVGLIGLLGSGTVNAVGGLLCLDRSHEGIRAETRCMASRDDGPAPQLLCVLAWCVRPVVCGGVVLRGVVSAGGSLEGGTGAEQGAVGRRFQCGPGAGFGGSQRGKVTWAAPTIPLKWHQAAKQRRPSPPKKASPEPERQGDRGGAAGPGAP